MQQQDPAIVATVPAGCGTQSRGEMPALQRSAIDVCATVGRHVPFPAATRYCAMTQPTTALSPESDKLQERAFAILPNDVARDVRLGPAALVLLAYRATFADTTAGFGLNAVALRRRPIVRGKGLGRDAIEAALRQATRAGYIARRQLARRSGRYGFAVDTLTLPPCSPAARTGWIVRRAWFDGQLSLRALAAYLYMRAGTGRGPIYAHELAARFAWSLTRARKALGELTQAGWIAPRQDRSADGTVVGVRYWLLPSANVHAHTPGDGLPGHGLSGHTRTQTYHVFPLGNDIIPMGEHQSPSRQAPPPIVTETHYDPDIAFADPALLGWAVDDPHRNSAELMNITAEDVAEIAAVCDDVGLASALMAVTDGRIAGKLLSPTGLLAVRTLAALIHKMMDGVSAVEALDIILEAVSARIGERPEASLGSLELIGRRLLHVLEWAATDIELYRSPDG